MTVEHFDDYIKRKLKLNDKFDIYHYQYIGWPDHSIPTSNFNLARLVMDVESSRSTLSETSITIHCRYKHMNNVKANIISAGMGRTGTLATILMHRQFKTSILEIVYSLRTMRHRRLVVESMVGKFDYFHLFKLF